MRIPLILQAERAECGLACVAMVAAAFGHRATLREHRARFPISLRGTTLRALRDYAESLGLRCRPVRADLTELRQLRIPAILHWDMNHFVVLKAVRNNRVLLVDPAVGERRLPYTDVGRRFTGIAMEVFSTPSLIRRDAAKPLGLRAFLPAFKGLGGSLTGIFAMTIALQVFAIILPLHTQFAVDQGVRTGDLGITVALAVGFGLVGLVNAATSYLRNLLVEYVGSTSAFRLVLGLAHHILRLPDAWFVARHTGDVLSRLSSTRHLRQFLTTGAFAILVDAAVVLASVAMLLAYSRLLAFASCIFLVVLVTVNAATFRHRRNLAHELIGADARERSSAIESIERHRAIKLLGAEQLREDIWGERLTESTDSHVRLARANVHVGFADASIRRVEVVTMLTLGAFQVIEGHFTLGMLVAFLSYSAMFSTRARALLNGIIEMRMLRLHQERVSDVLLEQPERTADGIPHEPLGRVAIIGVSYSYGVEEGDVVSDVDIHAEQGEFVAIQGESGSGKSTIIKLLCKLIEPRSGRIMIDDVDINRLNTSYYRGRLGVVMQDDDLFSGSLLENIALDDARADMKRVQWAAEVACIDRDIAQMPMRYLTLVGPMGSSLSGGQRQRIMIARAIYRQPKIILLDEGTAHLNHELRDNVLDNLIELNTTIIAATHDPQVAERADKKLVLPTRAQA